MSQLEVDLVSMLSGECLLSSKASLEMKVGALRTLLAGEAQAHIVYKFFVDGRLLNDADTLEAVLARCSDPVSTEDATKETRLTIHVAVQQALRLKMEDNHDPPDWWNHGALVEHNWWSITVAPVESDTQIDSEGEASTSSLITDLLQGDYVTVLAKAPADSKLLADLVDGAAADSIRLLKDEVSGPPSISHRITVFLCAGHRVTFEFWCFTTVTLTMHVGSPLNNLFSMFLTPVRCFVGFLSRTWNDL